MLIALYVRVFESRRMALVCAVFLSNDCCSYLVFVSTFTFVELSQSLLHSYNHYPSSSFCTSFNRILKILQYLDLFPYSIVFSILPPDNCLIACWCARVYPMMF